MQTVKRALTASILSSILLISAEGAFASDHADAPYTTTDPAADINDLYAWVDGDEFVMAMTVFPHATQDSRLSDAVRYVFNLDVSDGFTLVGPYRRINIITIYYSDGSIEVWFVEGYLPFFFIGGFFGGIHGDGTGRVYTGLRSDPFFFNQLGFADMVSAFQALAPMTPFDEAGCPAVDVVEGSVLVNLLRSTNNGASPAEDAFSAQNTLAIVVSIKKEILMQYGSYVGVWASTHQIQ